MGQVAIVLKNHYPQKQQATILLRQYGRVNVILLQERDCYKLSPGMLIICAVAPVSTSQQVLKIAQTELLSMPIVTIDHLLFLHQMIELCWHTIPVGLAVDDFFTELSYLLLNIAHFKAPELQKLLLCKLLTLLGIYPEQLIEPYNVLWQILQRPIDMIALQKIDLDLAAELLIWMRASVLGHPKGQLLKTWQIQ